MSDVKIKALIGFSDGSISMGVGEVRSVDSTKASAFIAGGLAEEYTDPVTPSGSINITENGEYDVAEKASAVVAVPQPTGSQNITANGTYDIASKATVVINVGVFTLSYNVNGGTGSIDSATVPAGATVLDSGSGITPPEGYTFKGWGTTDSATECVESPYMITENTTLYAVYELQG